MALAVVHDLREARAPAGPDELAAFKTDTLAGLVLARAAAGLADSTIAGEVIHLEQVRAWLGRPLWTMQAADADAYFGQALRGAARGTRLARAQALKTYGCGMVPGPDDEYPEFPEHEHGDRGAGVRHADSAAPCYWR